MHTPDRCDACPISKTNTCFGFFRFLGNIEILLIYRIICSQKYQKMMSKYEQLAIHSSHTPIILATRRSSNTLASSFFSPWSIAGYFESTYIPALVHYRPCLLRCIREQYSMHNMHTTSSYGSYYPQLVVHTVCILLLSRVLDQSMYSYFWQLARVPILCTLYYSYEKLEVCILIRARSMHTPLVQLLYQSSTTLEQYLVVVAYYSVHARGVVYQLESTLVRGPIRAN